MTSCSEPFSPPSWCHTSLKTGAITVQLLGCAFSKRSCPFQGLHHHGSQCILAWHPPRVLPQLPHRPTHPDGRGSNDRSVQERRLTPAAGPLWLGMLVLQNARFWLHVHGLPAVEVGVHFTLLEVHLLCWARRHRCVLCHWDSGEDAEAKEEGQGGCC